MLVLFSKPKLGLVVFGQSWFRADPLGSGRPVLLPGLALAPAPQKT